MKSPEAPFLLSLVFKLCLYFVNFTSSSPWSIKSSELYLILTRGVTNSHSVSDLVQKSDLFLYQFLSTQIEDEVWRGDTSSDAQEDFTRLVEWLQNAEHRLTLMEEEWTKSQADDETNRETTQVSAKRVA